MKDKINKRYKYGLFAGWFGVITNFILGILKIIIGIMSNSISIIADSLNNITDSLSSVLTIVGFNLSIKEPTKNHPYGYARYEYICGFIISLSMMLMGFMFLKESIVKIFDDSLLIISVGTYIVLIIAIIVKFIQMKIYIDCSIKINSNTLKTNAIDTRNDIISSFGILLSMIIMNVFNINIDGYIGVVISIFTIYSSIKMIKEVLGPIVGLMPDEERVNEIKEKLLSYDFVEGIHDLIIHNYGVNNDFVTVHVEIDSKMYDITSHNLVDNIENDFKKEGIHLTIHLDPVIIGDAIIDELKKRVEKEIKSMDEDLDIHDFRVIKGDYTSLLFDCVVPYDKQYTKEYIIKRLSKKMNTKKNKYYFIIEIDRPFS